MWVVVFNGDNQTIKLTILLRPRKVLLRNLGKIKSELTHYAHSSQALAYFQHSLASNIHRRT
jgi:hypothetical protein